MKRLALLLVLVSSVPGCFWGHERRRDVYIEPERHEHFEHREERREQRREDRHEDRHDDHR